jgi:putative oxidoreductase
MYEESGTVAFGKLILRLSTGILMMLHGIAKLLNPAAVTGIGENLATNFGLPAVVAYAVYLGEVVGPILVILGLFTRFGGALMAINMVVAIILVHMGDVLTLTQNGGWGLELQGMFLFASLAIAFLGSGKFAVRPD